MAWIESHQTLEKHGKLLSLSQTLEIPKHQAIGHLHCLWWWSIDNAVDGRLDRHTPTIIADAAGWFEYLNWWQSRGEDPPHDRAKEVLVRPSVNSGRFSPLWGRFVPEAGRFVTALLDCGLLDGNLTDEQLNNDLPLVGISIHDWLDFCGDLVRKRIEKNISKHRKSKELHKSISSGRKSPPQGRKSPPIEGRKSPSTVPYRTVPYRTLSYSTVPVVLNTFCSVVEDKNFTDQLSKAYPNVLIDCEVEKMRAWLKANPSKARKKNWKRFVHGWISRQQKKWEESRGRGRFTGSIDPDRAAKLDAVTEQIEVP